MRSRVIGIWAVSICMLFAPSYLVAKNNHSGGGGNNGGGGGSSSNMPVNITFRDCTAGSPSVEYSLLHPEAVPADLCQSTPDDGVKSDTGFAYVDGQDGVEAFIALSGSTGALGLRLAQSNRALFLDFSACASGPCNPPFTSQDMTYASIDVDANASKRNGLLGMSVGEKISAPMRILFSDTADLSGNVWFTDFNPNVKGKNPCKDKGNYVTAERTSDTSWEIIFGPDTIACLSSNNVLLGTYTMPFQFTVEQQ